MKRLLSIEQANEQARNALRAFEKASENYNVKVKRYVYDGPIVVGKPMPKPEALIDFPALRRIDEAWRKLEGTEAKLREAYIQLARVQQSHLISGANDKQRR